MGLLILLALGLFLLWAGIVGYTLWLLTHPPRRTYASAVARGRPGDPGELEGEPRHWETWTFRTRGHDVGVWDIRGGNAAGPVIVMVHGWGDSRIGALARVPYLAPLASRLVLWDLPGQGESPGMCRLGTAEVDDLLALLGELGVDVLPVVYGWSLGAGVALAAAARQPERISAVVAESPYRFAGTPARNVLEARGLPWRMTLPVAIAILNLRFRGGLSRRDFDRARQAAEARCPILVVHGDCDEVSPIADGRAIAAAAAARGRMAAIACGRHNDLWTNPELAGQCAEQIQAFLAEALAPHAARR
jgi:uncharacterized protein